MAEETDGIASPSQAVSHRNSNEPEQIVGSHTNGSPGVEKYKHSGKKEMFFGGNGRQKFKKFLLLCGKTLILYMLYI